MLTKSFECAYGHECGILALEVCLCVCVFEHVHISVGLVTFSNHSLSYHLGMYSEDSKFFDTSRIWIFVDTFVFQ